jgi:hypothetical protein
MILICANYICPYVCGMPIYCGVCVVVLVILLVLQGTPVKVFRKKGTLVKQNILIKSTLLPLIILHIRMTTFMSLKKFLN